MIGILNLAGKRSSSRNGFSLVELLAVMVLIVLLATGVQLIMRRPLETARVRNSIEHFKNTEGSLRHACRIHRQNATIQFDSAANRFTWKRSKEPKDHSAQLYGLSEVRMTADDRGANRVVIDRQGRSNSYAVRFAAKSFQRWLVCCGGTGQILEFEDEREVEEIFSKIEARNDAG